MESACAADAWSRKHSTTANGFCSYIVPLAVALSQPRAIVPRRQATSPAQLGNKSDSMLDEALVLDTQLVSKDGLNHGLAWTRSHIYASTATTVYRWSFWVDDEPDTPQLIVDDIGYVVVDNIHADGQGGAPQGHTTRTLAIDDNEEYLYVSVGSYANIDKDSDRSRIRRFLLAQQDQNQTSPFDFRHDGQLFADGLRNEVALAFDANGVLWGIGNSGDDLFRADLGGDIHNDNPAEEVHQLGLNQHYGYPFCWREYQLEMGLGQGTAWAWPTTMDNVSDQDCRERYEGPAATLPAHSAPLGMTFYRYQNVTSWCPGVIPFPPELDGFAFIAYHGSWNRDIPTGYKVVYIDLHAIDSVPTDLLTSAGCYAKWHDGTRPVDLAFDQCGRLWVTSDGSRGKGSHLIVIESTSMVLLPQPPTEIPCAWRLPVWAISLISVTGCGLILMGGVLLFVRRTRFCRTDDTVRDEQTCE